MTEENKRKNKIIGISIGILVVLLVVISSTYAYWQITKAQDDANVLKAACLDLHVEFGESLSLQSEWPIDDSEALKDLTGYKFTVTNNCPYATNYVVGLESVTDEKIKEYMSYASVALAIDNNPLGTYDLLPNLTGPTANARASKELMTGEIGQGETKTHQLKLWIDKNSTVDDQSKGFAGKIFLIGGQGIENDNELLGATPESCFGFDEATGEITSYKEECGTSVVIPNSINDKAVKVIDTNAFKGTKLTTKYLDENFELTDSIDVSDMTMAVVFDNYVEGEELPTMPTYIISFTDDEELNAYWQSQATAMNISLYNAETAPETLNVGQIKMYQKHTKTGTYTDGNPNTTLDKIAAEYLISSTSLLVDSLDLSKAYNLEKIEEVAFSNAELVKVSNGNCITVRFDENKNYPVGLKSLTFGDNKNLISLEAGAFAFGDFENLVINTNFVQDSSKYNCVVDDNGTILGHDVAPILYKSNIDNLTVKPLKENDVYTGQKTETEVTVSTAGMIVNNLTIASGIKEIGESAFTGSTFNSISLPEGLEKIGADAFRGTLSTLNLSTLTIPSTVTYIGAGAFNLPATCNLTVNRSATGMTLGANWHGDAEPHFAE